MSKPVSPTFLADTQNQRDHRRIAIDRVGVRGLKYPIRVRDKSHAFQETVAVIQLSVDLPHHFKGTHMSRFVEVLNSHGREIHIDALSEILGELRKKLDADCAHLRMEFPYFIEKSAPVSGAKGLMDYTVIFDACSEKETEKLVGTIIVPVATLCPCSKAISDRGAHNQRGYVTLTVGFGPERVWIEDLISLVEASASSPLYSLLKRPDEKYVTEAAYDNPVFVEDLVRNVAARLNGVEEILWYRVEAENMESIHNHAAFAVIESQKAS